MKSKDELIEKLTELVSIYSDNGDWQSGASPGVMERAGELTREIEHLNRGLID